MVGSIDLSWRASQAISTSSPSLWSGVSGIIQTQRLIWLLLPTRGSLPLLKLVAQRIYLSVLEGHWLRLPKLFIAPLLMRARHILVLVIWALRGVDCARDLLVVAFFALLLHMIVVLLPPGYGASHQIRTLGKLTLDLGDFLYFECTVFDVLLNPLHLG